MKNKRDMCFIIEGFDVKKDMCHSSGYYGELSNSPNDKEDVNIYVFDRYRAEEYNIPIDCVFATALTEEEAIKIMESYVKEREGWYGNEMVSYQQPYDIWYKSNYDTRIADGYMDKDFEPVGKPYDHVDTNGQKYLTLQSGELVKVEY